MREWALKIWKKKWWRMRKGSMRSKQQVGNVTNWEKRRKIGACCVYELYYQEAFLLLPAIRFSKFNFRVGDSLSTRSLFLPIDSTAIVFYYEDDDGDMAIRKIRRRKEIRFHFHACIYIRIRIDCALEENFASFPSSSPPPPQITPQIQFIVAV